jgi:hypothetical protein
MSYLRGPLTRPQIQQLMADRKASVQAAEPAPPVPQARILATATAPAPASTTPEGYAATPPTLDPSVSQVFLPLEWDEEAALHQLTQEAGRGLQVERAMLVYEPAILGGANVRFVDRKRNINEQVSQVLLAPPPTDLGGLDWERAEALNLRLDQLVDTRPPAATEGGPFFAPAPESANSPRELKEIARSLEDWLYYHSRLSLTLHPELDLFQRPGEGERAFNIRLQQVARERRDAEVDALTEKYETRIERLDAKLRKEERELISDEAEYEARKSEARLTMGETALSFLMGRRRTRGISTVATKRRLADKAKLEAEETREEIEDLEEEIAELEEELGTEIQAITDQWVDLLDDLTTEEIHPRRTDVDVRLVALAWLPSWLITYDDGIRAREATIAAYLPPETTPSDLF